MRVDMVSEHASPLAALGGVDSGGQNVHVASLATELGRRGIAVVVHTRRDDPLDAKRVRLAPNVVVNHVDAGPPAPLSKDLLLPYMDEFSEELFDCWSREPPDLVHSHFWMSGKAALAAAKPSGIPVAHTFHALGVVKKRHQGSNDTSPTERLGEEDAIIREVDHIIATCSDEMFELLRLGADADRISVVPCGVDTRVFRPDGPTAERTPGCHRVVVVSRLVERKGIGDVIAALAEVRESELVVAGGGEGCEPEAERLESVARGVGVRDRVRLVGRVERDVVPPLIRSADVVACTPWYEPFGIVPLEAMACGIPVVASAVGGLMDTVVDGVTGIHVPPRRPDRIAAAIRELLADPALRAMLGAAGVRRARHRYSWERVADGTLDVYRRVVPVPALVGREVRS